MSAQRRCIGILREVKNKWERRCPLSPTDVRSLTSQGIRVLVQPSQMRIFKDHEFKAAGAEVIEDLSDAHTIFGVKEFPHTQLLPNKSYVIFSHVIKAQPYNMPFLDACLQKNVRLFDYETIRATKENGGQRLVFFGRFAGMAGMIDAFRGTGERLLSLGYSTPFMGISSSYMYPSVEAAKQAVKTMGQAIVRDGLPPAMAPMRFAFTGTGNVSHGAQEIFNLLPHEWVSPYDLPHIPKNENKVYGAIITAEHMVQHISSTSNNNRHLKFDKQHYYANPHEYRGIFHSEIAPHINVLVNGMYWDPRFPRLLTIEQMADLERTYKDQKTRGLISVADISCDIGGSVEFLKRSTTIDKPFYMYDPKTDSMRDLIEGPGVLMLGVDNLPAEFPREASDYFSSALKPFVAALAQSDCSKPFDQANYLPPELMNACITADGRLTPQYEYIQKLRASNEKRTSSSTYNLKKTDDEITVNLMLEGHLFDTGYINQALDLFEIHAKMFRVIHWDISPNRSERRSTVSRAVVEVTAETQAKLEEVITMIKTLATAMPRAMVRVSQLETRTQDGQKQLQGVTRDDEPIVFSATSSSLGTSASTATTTTSAPSSTSKPTKNVLVLGSGYVAGPLIDYLARMGYGLTVASISLQEAQRLIHGYQHTNAVQLDVADVAAVRTLISKHDAVVSLLPATMHLPIADACIDLRRPMVTASYVSPGMRERHERASAAGIAILNEVGLDPGLDHMSAMSIIHDVQSHGGEITSFESVCGGLPAPEAANNPLGYKFSWNPLGVLNASQNAATYKQDGKIINIAGSDLLRSSRPYILNPAFHLEQLPNRDSLSYATSYGIPNVQTMYRGTLRYHGFCTILDGLAKLGLLNRDMKPVPKPATWASLLSTLLPKASSTSLDTAMRAHLSTQFTPDEIDRIIDAANWLGLTSSTPIPTLPHHASPNTPQPTQHTIIQSLCHLLEKRLVYTPEERDLVLLDHKFGIKWKNGEREIRRSTLISYGGDGKPRLGGGLGGGSGLHGYSAMARTVGLPTAISTHLLLQGAISRVGVLTPVTSDIYGPALKMLHEEGIECRESSVKLPPA